MTVPSRARRHAANVEVMRLNTREDMVAARRWLNAHGVAAGHWPGNRLRLLGPKGDVTASLGQVLTFDPTTGEFAVLDAAVYDKTHTAAQGVVE